MKNKILTLTFLILMMSVITSSRESDIGVAKSENNTCQKSCLSGCNDYAVNTVCKKVPLVKEAELSADEAEDSDLPLNPISRFILLQ